MATEMINVQKTSVSTGAHHLRGSRQLSKINPSTRGRNIPPHSIINEPSKPLISKCFQVARSSFTVIFTVKVSGTSIGAGFRAIRRKVTFRDLSTSIGSGEHCRSYQWTPLQVRQGPHMPTASNCISHCQQTFFHPQFYRHKATPASDHETSAAGMTATTRSRAKLRILS